MIERQDVAEQAWEQLSGEYLQRLGGDAQQGRRWLTQLLDAGNRLAAENVQLREVVALYQEAVGNAIAQLKRIPT